MIILYIEKQNYANLKQKYIQKNIKRKQRYCHKYIFIVNIYILLINKICIDFLKEIIIYNMI